MSTMMESVAWGMAWTLDWILQNNSFFKEEKQSFEERQPKMSLYSSLRNSPRLLYLLKALGNTLAIFQKFNEE